jgi:hypothetical protein
MNCWQRLNQVTVLADRNGIETAVNQTLDDKENPHENDHGQEICTR